MRVLVTGANGFLGAQVVSALRAAGHHVIGAERHPQDADSIACDFSRDLDVDTWKPRLAGIDAVVNCAGILREAGASTFQRVHVAAPTALFRACAALGVRRVIQLSALGEPEDGEFIASKHRGDAALSALDLDWLVLRPGLVYSAHGAYGGTLLLRALAAYPGILLLPGRGDQPIRPLASEDLCAAIVAGLEPNAASRVVVQMVGRDEMTLREYLLSWRRWFGLGQTWIAATPHWSIGVAATLGELWGRGPICRAIVNLLERKRTGSADAIEQTRTQLKREPAALAHALAARPARASDLLEARWYWVQPVLVFVLGALWIASGIVGLLVPASVAQAQLPAWPADFVERAGVACSIMDLALGVLLWSGRRRQVVLSAMLAMVTGYTLVIGTAASAHWFDPFGGLWKNFAVAALIVVLLALPGDRR